MIPDFVLFFAALSAGTLGLYYGAEWLVNGSKSIALKTGMSPMLIGLTIVAFATSSPELIVSLKAALQGNPSIAVGNVVGSNIANIGLVLGLTALIYPIRADKNALYREMPLMIAIVFVMFGLMYNHMFTRLEGIFLIILLAGFIFFQSKMAKKQMGAKMETPSDADDLEEAKPIGLAFLLITAGAVLLLVGSNWFLYGSKGIGSLLGLSDAVIGLTLVSVGTSLPELATSLIAAIRKESDIALGNIIGSNIFNVLCILGVTATIHPLSGGDITWTDLTVMLAFSVMLWPMMFHKMTLGRVKATLLFGAYVGYLTYLFR